MSGKGNDVSVSSKELASIVRIAACSRIKKEIETPMSAMRVSGAFSEVCACRRQIMC